MPEPVEVTINGSPIKVEQGTTVLVALHRAGVQTCRRSSAGEQRGALCAMGICFECRVTIDDRPNVRACAIVCRQGMRIVSDA